jgi:hypothetical protein
MNTSMRNWKVIGLIAGIVAVAAVSAFIYMRATPTPQGIDSSMTATNGAPGSVSATGSVATQPSQNPSGGAPVAGAVITVHLLTPITGNVWTVGKANPIAWDKAAQTTGEIDLVNASTKKFVGIILAETGPKQTSYTWDAREIYLGRYSADEKAVAPGIYSIRIHFDGNNLGDLISGPITITN